MSIRSILAVFNGTVEELPMLEVACELAKKHQAHVRCLHVSPLPAAYDGIYGESFIITANIAATIEKENRERLEQAKEHFASMMKKCQCSVADQATPPLRHASASFMHRDGAAASVVAEEGRLSDIILLHRALTGATSTTFEAELSAALFGTGRPLLLIPGGKPVLPIDHTVAVAWKDTKEAVRTLHAALPFLTQAEKTYVLMLHKTGAPVDLADKEKILAYLALHGVNAQLILVDGKGEDPGETLLKRTKELNAGLLVMGAYGHSRFRETVLGGMTEYMLNHAGLPLFMMH